MPVICTLFENDYHLGVSVLANSLYAAGFRGTLYAGYRGDLPSWAKGSQNIPSGDWARVDSFVPAQGLEILFIQLKTPYHLTNYKPDFMLALLEGLARDADGILYLDPDVTVLAPWSFIEEWLNSGIAVCEDVNSPVPNHHPRRVAWRRFYSEHGIHLHATHSEYANGGLVGISRSNRGFLELWRRIQEAMAETIGGLEKSSLANGGLAPTVLSPYHPFSTTDQDALNIAIGASEIPASFLSRAAMGFVEGAASFPHAVGSNKPWRKDYLVQALKGIRPTAADRAFWNHASGPIHPYSRSAHKMKTLTLRMATLAGRFYSK